MRPLPDPIARVTAQADDHGHVLVRLAFTEAPRRAMGMSGALNLTPEQAAALGAALTAEAGSPWECMVTTCVRPAVTGTHCHVHAEGAY